MSPMSKRKKFGLHDVVTADQLTEESFSDGEVPADVLEAVRDSLRNLRFGQVTIVVHNGEVVQIDRTERRRLV